MATKISLGATWTTNSRLGMVFKARFNWKYIHKNTGIRGKEKDVIAQ
jgi:hypothetical protein